MDSFEPFGDEPSGGTLYSHIRVERRREAAYVSLARPEVRNAFDAALIAELTHVFQWLDSRDDVRAIVLRGDGRHFCAGADLNWMRASLDFSREDNTSDALRMSDMFRAIDSCRHPVIGRIQGAALGGGSGLAAVCDIVIAASDARFGFTEARLGIAPAVISPFVLRKIGVSSARALFLTAEQFDSQRALSIGLVHQVVAPEQLDEAVDRTLRDVFSCSPRGVRAAKQLCRTVPDLPEGEARELTAGTIADLRTSPEGQEGIRAFLEKRPAAWIGDHV